MGGRWCTFLLHNLFSFKTNNYLVNGFRIIHNVGTLLCVLLNKYSLENMFTLNPKIIFQHRRPEYDKRTNVHLLSYLKIENIPTCTYLAIDRQQRLVSINN